MFAISNKYQVSTVLKQYVASIGEVICDLDCAILDVYERLWTFLLTIFLKLKIQSLSVLLGLP